MSTADVSCRNAQPRQGERVARLTVVSDKRQYRELREERGYDALVVLEGQYYMLDGVSFDEVEDLTYTPKGQNSDWWEQVYSQMGGAWPPEADPEPVGEPEPEQERLSTQKTLETQKTAGVAKQAQTSPFPKLARYLTQPPEPLMEVRGPVRAAIRRGPNGVLLDGIADLDFIRGPGRRRWGGRLVVGERTAAALVGAGVLTVFLPNGRSGECLATRHLVGKATVEVEGIGPAPFGDVGDEV